MKKFITRKPWAYDIETNTEAEPFTPEVPAGLDPRAGDIISFAISNGQGGAVFDSTEAGILQAASLFVQGLDVKTNVLLDWNGAVFDGPYLSYRADLLGLNIGLELEYDPEIPVKYSPLPTFKGGYRMTWHGVPAIDISGYFKDFAKSLGISNSLKPITAALGYKPMSVDAANAALLDKQLLADYNLSDTNATVQAASHLIVELGKVVVLPNPAVKVEPFGEGHFVYLNGVFHAYIEGRKVSYENPAA